MVMCELSEGAGSTWVAAVSEDWKHNDCCLLLKPLQTQHNAHGCYCTRVSQLRVGAGGVTCRWRLTIAQYRSVIFGFCTDRCTYWPFAHLSRTVNLLCALMLWREMQWKSLPGRRIFTAKRDAISSLRSEFLITFFFWQLFEYLYGLHFMLDLHFTKDVSRNGKEGASCVEQSEMAEEKCCLAFCFHLNRCEWRWFLSPLTLCTRSSNRGKIL